MRTKSEYKFNKKENWRQKDQEPTAPGKSFFIASKWKITTISKNDQNNVKILHQPKPLQLKISTNIESQNSTYSTTSNSKKSTNPSHQNVFYQVK